MPEISLYSTPSSPTDPAVGRDLSVEHNMYRGADLFFYHHPEYCDNPFPRPLKYQELISRATTSIKIWDPYFKPSPGHDFEFFSFVNENVEVELLTLGEPKKVETPFWENLKATILPLLAGKSNITFRFGYIEKSDTVLDNWKFHDRFLIVDDNYYAFVGCSLNDHVFKASKSSAIMMVQNPLDKKLVDLMYNLYFNRAELKGKVFFDRLS